MGKLKRNRNNRKARVNPLGEKKVGKEDQRDENTRKSKILPLINNLKSSVPNEKSMALGALTVICEDARMRKLCLREKLVPLIMEQCLNDSNDEIVVEAFGLLRNLGIEEGYDVITYYWRQNIWVALEAGLNKIEKSFKFLAENKALPDNNAGLAKKVDEKAKIQLLYDFTENILSMVLVLAGGSDSLYDNVFQRIDPVLRFVIDLINWNTPNIKTSLKLHNTLLEFIYEFSTESFEFIEKLNVFGNFNVQLLTAGPEKNLLGRGYVEGIKYQIYESEQNVPSSEKKEQVFKTLTNISHILADVDLNSIKTNFATPDNANDPITKPIEAGSGEEKMQDIDQQISGDTPEKTQAKDDIQLLEVSIDLFTSIWEFLATIEGLQPVTLGDDLVNVIFKGVYPILSELIQFDIRNNHILQLSNKILICFNNLCWLMLSSETIPSEWFEISTKLWELAIQISTNTQSLQVLKNCLNVCWAIIKTIGPAINLSPEMINGLIAKCNGMDVARGEGKDALDHFEFILSSVGFLGSSAQVISNIEITKNISDFLLSLINGFTSKEFIDGTTIISTEDKTKAYEVVIESLDLFYDIFGDAEYPYDLPVFVQGDYLSKLRALEPQVKDMYKKIDKNKFKELKSRGEETWNNMNRFIEYKASERR